MDTDNDDVYKSVLDNIQQIQNEILFMLDQTNLNNNSSNDDDEDEDDSKRFLLTNANLNSYCDILLEKVNKEIVWTNNLEEQQNNNYFIDRYRTTPTNNNNSIEQQQVGSKFQFTPADSTTTIEQQQRSQIHNDLNTNIKHSIINEQIITNGDGDGYGTNKKSEPEKNDQQIANDKRSWISNKKHPFINGSSSSQSRSSSSSTEQQQLTPNSTNELDKESNYRYSFYDNYYIENALIYLSKCGLNSVGIFRKSGVKSRINMLKEKIQKNEINFDTLCESVYDVADLVKTWLRDLHPHLLTNQLIDMFIVATKSKNDINEQFHLWHLDDCHRYLLFIILKFLSMVAAHSSENQMNTQNLAICFAPSLCDGDTEKQINRAQKCLQYCIENYESLFYLNVKNIHLIDKHQRQSTLPMLNNNHTSVIIINASPDDILARLLYERNMIDKLISRWTIINDDDHDDHHQQQQQINNSDIFEFDLQFSCLLPTKTFSVHRQWSNSKQQQGGFELTEIGDLIRSYWIMVPNGKGQTLVKHDILMELRGLSSKWYRTIYPAIHDQQLKCLASSFIVVPMNGTRISEV
ncbi:Dynein light chain Tctex-type [Dermatophagoides farinae]|uniref:Dynein light chain Tctex-type n=1 Tax=Dermatophagoides farinae TaxID=6954 RepID=A0A922I7H7_DERFA|nr:Dynein light chain Tctex-type [Dermatophagoides farinae]